MANRKPQDGEIGGADLPESDASKVGGTNGAAAPLGDLNRGFSNEGSARDESSPYEGFLPANYQLKDGWAT